MITIGGLTRITGSGLSITEWDPIMGAIPPLSDAAWHDAFAKYQRIPQYILENRGMSLDAFKGIFWWEWTHRLLGRLLGVVFFVPFVLFAWIGAIRRSEWPRMLLLFALGGLQGFVGWWMVESGLETRVSVSQYRLADPSGRGAHPARSPFCGWRWNICGVRQAERAAPRRCSSGCLADRDALLVYFQMLLGALVAGLHAGLIYNTWPLDGWTRCARKTLLVSRPGGSISSRIPAWRNSTTASAPISSRSRCSRCGGRSASLKLAETAPSAAASRWCT